MSNNFRLDVSAYQQQLLKNRQEELKALVVVQYPVYWIRATVREISDSALQMLDRKVLHLIRDTRLDELDMADLLGINKPLVNARLKHLEKEGLFSVEKRKLTESGEQLLSEPSPVHYETVLRDFYVDGISHTLFPDSFIDDYGRFFTQEATSSFGAKEQGGNTGVFFNPDIPHKPMSISELEQTFHRKQVIERFKLIEASDPVKMTYPILAVLAVHKSGPRKYVVNGFDKQGAFPESFDLSAVDRYLGYLNIKAFSYDSNGQSGQTYSHFTTNWEDARAIQEAEKWIFDVGTEDLKRIISQKYGIEITDDNILTTKESVSLTVAETMIQSSPYDKRQKLLFALYRGHDRVVNFKFQQRIYLVIFEVKPADSLLIAELLSTFEICQESASPEDAIVKLSAISESLDFPIRKLLVLSGAFRILEVWDLQNYMHQ